MFSTIWHTFFFDPVYNALIFFIEVIPGGDVGLAIVATTVAVKVVLLPLSLKAARTQKIMRELQPELEELKKKYKDKKQPEDRAEQAREMMALYRNAGMNPFASIFLMLLQIPILIALYLSVASGGGVALPEINTALLYSFIPTPTLVDMVLLGVLDITAANLPLAILAGITMYIYGSMTIKPAPAPAADQVPNFKDDFARTMQLQMKYIMPVVIAGVAYFLSAAIAIYFVVSNLMQIAQEFIIRRERN